MIILVFGAIDMKFIQSKNIDGDFYWNCGSAVAVTLMLSILLYFLYYCQGHMCRCKRKGLHAEKKIKPEDLSFRKK